MGSRRQQIFDRLQPGFPSLMLTHVTRKVKRCSGEMFLAHDLLIARLVEIRQLLVTVESKPFKQLQLASTRFVAG